MSDNISYYELLQPIRYKYNANIRIRIGFWVVNIQIQFFIFVSALNFIPHTKYVRGILWISRGYADTSSFMR